MKNDVFEQLLRQGLALDTAEIPAFIEQIESKDVREKVRHLLSDDEALTQFFVNTAAGSDAFASINFQDLQPGDTVGHVVVKKLLAKGGMGCVYLGFDKKLKRQVALKTIRSEYVRHPMTQQRFEQEALVLSQINHPCICQIYERIESDRGNALVLEYIDGETLATLDLDHKTLLDAFIEIASALAAAHDHGITHRDLKPDNIMRTRSGQIKILDFGIAKSDRVRKQPLESTATKTQDTLTQHGSLVGTLTYMSPEQMAGKGVSEASDLYSMGIIMYELLTGESPYTANTPDLLQQAVMEADLKPMDRVPRAFRSVIQQLTQKIPVHRPSAGSLRDQLVDIRQAPERRRQKKIKVAALSFIGALALLLLWQQYQYRADIRKQQFFNDIRTSIEDNREALDKIYTLPKHDITDQLAESMATHQKLVQSVEAHADLNAAEKNLLIGESWYATDQYQKTINYLEPAWNAGMQTPDTAYKLAHAYSMVYRNRSFELSAGRQKLEDAEKNKIVAQAQVYFAFLQQHGEGVGPMLKAYEAYFEGEYTRALESINVKEARKQGAFRDLRLLGLVYKKLYEQAVENKQADKAQTYFEQSEAAYAQAIDFGRSFARSYSDLCGLYQRAIRFAIVGVSEEVEVPFEKVKATCQSASEVYPYNSNLISFMSGFLHRYAEWMMLQGVDAMPILEEALQWNQKSLNQYRHQNQPNADTEGDIYLNRAIIYDLMASYQLRQGLDPSTTVQQALDAYQVSVNLMPYAITPITSNMFYSLIVQSKHQLAIGEDPQPLMQKAQDLWSRYSESEDKERYDPVHLMRSYGDLHQLMAFAAAARKQAFTDWIEQSNSWYQQALSRDAKRATALGGLATNALFMAEQAYFSKTLTEQQLNALDAVVEKALEKGQKFYWIALLKANSARLHYQFAVDNALPPQLHFKDAEIWYTEALQRNSTHFQVYVDQAKLYWLRVQKSGKKTDWNTSFHAVETAINYNPYSAEALLLKAHLMEIGLRNAWINGLNSTEIQQLKQQAYTINPKATLSI